jgi:hypothetical protein
MKFTTELLSRLEQNNDLKKSYATMGSLGQNKLIALPVIIGLFSGFAAYFFNDLSKTDASYSAYTIGSIVVVVICIIALFIMQSNAKKTVLENPDNIKICLAKKIYGNDQTDVHYGIYTVGEKRHDPNFIETIAEKIFDIEEEQDLKIKKQIQTLFTPKMEGSNATPTLLPLEFTLGEKVYQKEFDLKYTDERMKQDIEDSGDKFVVLSFNDVNAQVLRSLGI